MKELRASRWFRPVGIYLVLLGLGWLLLRFDLFSRFDQLFYDSVLRSLNQEAAQEIVLIEIDQKSLAKLGRWPWRRHLHARLVERLSEASPAVLGLDVNFAEADLEHPEDDRMLLEALVHYGRVVLPVVLEQESLGGPLRETLPLPPFAQAAAALGHVDIELDGDGLARSVYLMAGLQMPRWPAFALAMMEVTGKWQRGDPLPGERAPAPRLARSWHRDYRVLVPLAGNESRFRTYSFVDVLEGKVPPEAFTNRYVLVGVTAAGLGDNIPTPVSMLGRPTTGLEFNATVLDGLLGDRMIIEVPHWLQFLVLALVLLLLLLLYHHFGRSLVPWSVGLLLLVAGVSYLLLAGCHCWLPPSVMLFMVLVAMMLVSWQQVHYLLKALFEERRLSHAALTSIGDAVFHLDGKMRISKTNPQAEALLGLESRKLVGERFTDLVRLKRGRKGQEPFLLDLFLNQGKQVNSETLTLIRHDGKKVPVHLAATVIPGGKGGSVLVLTDLSREQELAKALAHRETHSLLTGLPTHRLLLDRLRRMLRRAHTLSYQVAVVHLDLDHFAKINQVLGIDVGDEVLQQVAQRLISFRKRGIEVGHVSGDEFLVLIEGRGVYAQVKALRELFAKPLRMREREMKVSVTLGVSIYPENLVEAEELMRQANIALHQGKLEQRGGISCFRQDMKKRAARVMEINTLLQSASQEGLLETFYQPIVATRDLRITGVECLMRLKDGQGGYISPEEFIPLADDSGLISDLAYHQLYEACVQLEKWRREGLPSLRLCYNFSLRQLRSPDLLEKLQVVLKVTGFDPHRLELEITENLVLLHGEQVSDILDNLEELGIRLVVDDFGTGYSSMAYLTRFRFSRLKIDKSFVLDLEDTPGSRAIVAAIIGMAHSLNMGVVAEGVETDSQMESLVSLACDELQGYYLGRPMPAAEFHRYLMESGGHARPAEDTDQ
jgi:diguanylate cyclase (GGDEF)-like protein/PAS domain S-box-containing protein